MEMREIKDRIQKAGLKFNFIAQKAGISPQRLSMCLNEKRTMPDEAASVIKRMLK